MIHDVSSYAHAQTLTLTQTSGSNDLDVSNDSVGRGGDRTFEEEYRDNNPFGTKYGPVEYEDNPNGGVGQSIFDGFTK